MATFSVTGKLQRIAAPNAARKSFSWTSGFFTFKDATQNKKVYAVIPVVDSGVNAPTGSHQLNDVANAWVSGLTLGTFLTKAIRVRFTSGSDTAKGIRSVGIIWRSLAGKR